MKLIEPSVELIKQEPGLEGIYKQIEVAARLCYKSENKIIDVVKIDLQKIPDSINVNDLPNYKENKEECLKFLKENNIPYSFISSAESFVNMLKERSHNAMLEHGTVYLAISDVDDTNLWYEIKNKYEKNKYSNVINVATNLGNMCYITTNYRVLIENNWLDDLKYLKTPTFHEKRYTLKFTTSIGITREITRHRHMSFACESTRYCNYSKDKFGGEITFVKPTWVNIPSELSEGTMLKDGLESWCNPNYIHIYCRDVKSKWFMKACLETEYSYLHAINEQNATPQEAREMLPLATKSEIIMTGFESDWKDFFKLRCDKAAHPDMQIIANKAKEIIDNEKSKIV